MTWPIHTTMMWKTSEGVVRYYTKDSEGWFLSDQMGKPARVPKFYSRGVLMALAVKAKDPKRFATLTEVVDFHIKTDCGHILTPSDDWPLLSHLEGATVDCPECGQLLIFKTDTEKFELRALDFHKYLHSKNPEWPAEGEGTGYVEVD